MSTKTREELELEQLKRNSPFSLPDDTALSKLTPQQIKEKFYSGFFYLYSLFKELRQTTEGDITDQNATIAIFTNKINQFIESTSAAKDSDGNIIVDTYAKITELRDGTIAVMKYLKQDGTSANIYSELVSLGTAVQSLSSLFTNSSANNAIQATQATKAQKDWLGRIINDTYATVSSLSATNTEVANIKNGTTIVSKAAYIASGANTLGYSDIATKTDIQNVMDVAAGKTKTYALNYNNNTGHNSDFNSTEGYIILSKSYSILTTNGISVNLSDLKIGDMILLENTDVPDRWVSSIINDSMLVFTVLDARKVDISGKLDKVTSTSAAPQAYIKSTDGTQIMIDVAQSPVSDAIVRRDGTQVNVPLEPVGNSDATSKYYVDLHKADTSNPHSVTKAQVGLGNVDNTSDANKPVSTAQQAENLKMKYNLGDFDTVDTSDSKYDIITRRTGHYKFTGQEFLHNSSGNYPLFYLVPFTIGYDGVVDTTSADNIKTNFGYKGGLTNPNTYYPNKIEISNGYFYFQPTSDIDSVSKMKKLLAGNVMTFILPSALQYTEKVIKNQPLITLDKQGSEFVKKEWEKSQNLWDENWGVGFYSTSNGTRIVANDALCSNNPIKVKPNTTYFISSPYTANNQVPYIFYYDASGNFVGYSYGDSGHNSSAFTTPSTCYLINFGYPNLSTPVSYNNNIMLVEGDHIYPYQPYSGAPVHEQDIADMAKTNVNNNFSTTQTINANGQGQTLIVNSSDNENSGIQYSCNSNVSGYMGVSNKKPYWWGVTGGKSDGEIATINTDITPITDLLAEMKSIIYDNIYPAIAEQEVSYAEWFAVPTAFSTDAVIHSAGSDLVEVKGRSYVYNQLVSNPSVEITHTMGSANTENSYSCEKLKANHKYLIIVTAKVNASSYITYLVGVTDNAVATYQNNVELSTSYQTFYITTSTVGADFTGYAYVFVRASDPTGSQEGQNLSTKNAYLVDLTQWFNGDIPTEVINDPSLFTKKYWKNKKLPYDTGHIEDSKLVKVVSKGFNIWDEEYVNGYFGGDGTFYESGSEVASKNLIKVIPNAVYYIKNPTTTFLSILEFDSNGNFIAINYNSNNTLTVSSKTSYIKFNTNNSYGGTYNHDICISLANSSMNGTYTEHIEDKEYPVLPVDMATVNLGSLTYDKGQRNNDNTGYVFYANILANMKPYGYATCDNNMKCRNDDVYWETLKVNEILISLTKIVVVVNADTAEEAKAALNGIILHYELANQIHAPLRSAGSVADTIDKNGVITRRVGVFYPSEATGDIVDNNTVGVFAFILPSNAKGTPYTIHGLSDASYSATGATAIPEYQPDKTFVINSDGIHLQVKDTDFANESFNTFKASLSGKCIYYELAFPYTEQASPLPENIEVQKGGSIECVYNSGEETPSDVKLQYAVSKVVS